MAFLPKKWLRALWGIKAPDGEIEPPAPPRSEGIRRTLPSTRPPSHPIESSPVDRQVAWGGGLFGSAGDLFPRRSKPSLLN